MINQDLDKYIQSARNQNISDVDIRYQLKKIGWNDGDINEALTLRSSSTPTPPPPPPAVTHFGMWVTFQYIILFISLYVSAIALTGIFYAAVARFSGGSILPGYSYMNVVMNGYVSALIVAYPIFAILFIILNKQTLEKPAIRQLRARKQLIYATLIITFINLIWQIISTINSFLGGENAVLILGYLGVTLLIAGTIFVYLLFQVKEDQKQT